MIESNVNKKHFNGSRTRILIIFSLISCKQILVLLNKLVFICFVNFHKLIGLEKKYCYYFVQNPFKIILKQQIFNMRKQIIKPDDSIYKANRSALKLKQVLKTFNTNVKICIRYAEQLFLEQNNVKNLSAIVKFQCFGHDDSGNF